MDQTTILKTIKFKPYQGQDSEIYEGEKTKVTLFENRIEYKMKFTQKVMVTFFKDDEPVDKKEADNFCEQDGMLFKSSITGVSKYIETEYNKVTGEPINIQYVDLAYKGSVLTFSCSTEAEKDKLHKTIYNWILNIEE